MAADSKAWRSDLLCIAVAVLACAVLSVTLELHESYVAWVAHFERWEFDEAPLSALVLAFGLVWYALRRRGELAAELRRRVAAEDQAATLLARNRELARRIIQAQEAERLAVAREVHDELGQRCSAILVETAQLRRSAAADPARDAALLGAAARADIAAHGLYLLLRGLLARLRPPQLDALGLLAALQQLCEDWETRTGIACVFHHDGVPGALDDTLNITVYRVLQESLTNVLRHADASQVRALLVADAGTLTLTVQDDGCGIDAAAASPPRGLGLLGAAERAAAVGGTLQVDGRPGQGVLLSLRLPLPAAAAPAVDDATAAAAERQRRRAA